MLEMLQPFFKRKNQPASKPTIKILISGCLGLRKVEELQTQLVANLHHRLGQTVDIVCLERDLGGSHMLHVEINGRCVLRRETIRDTDSQNIPYFIQGFLNQQAGEQLPWQPKLQYDYLVLGSTGMHSYFSETQRDREPKPEESEQPERLDSSVAESETKETPLKKCRSHHSRIRELKPANKSGQVSKPVNNSYTANPHRRDQDASSSKEHSQTAVLQRKGDMHANLTSPQIGKMSRPSPFKQLGKIVPSFERLQSPLRNTANKENSLKPIGKSSQIISNPLLKQPSESKPAILKDGLKKKQSMESPEPRLKIVDRKQDSMKNPSQIQSSGTSPKRPVSTCAAVSAPKVIKPSLFRNPPSAVENTKLKELEQSKIIRFRGNRPIAHRQLGKQQAANSSLQSKQNITEQQSLPEQVASTHPAFNESQCELPIKHCTVFEDLTLGAGSPTDLEDKVSLNIPPDQNKQESKLRSEGVKQPEQGSELLESAKEETKRSGKLNSGDTAVEKGRLALVGIETQQRDRNEQSAHNSRVSPCPLLEVTSKASLAGPQKECGSSVKLEGVTHQQVDYDTAVQEQHNAQVNQREQSQAVKSSVTAKQQVTVHSSTKLNVNSLTQPESVVSCQQVEHQKVLQEVNGVTQQLQIHQYAVNQQQLSEEYPSPAEKQQENPCSLSQPITSPAPLAQQSSTAVPQTELAYNSPALPAPTAPPALLAPSAPPVQQTNEESFQQVIASSASARHETDKGTLERSSIVQQREQPPAISTKVASEARLSRVLDDTMPANNQLLDQVVVQLPAILQEANAGTCTTDVPALPSHTQTQPQQAQATQAITDHQAPQSTQKSVTSEPQQEEVAGFKSQTVSGSLQRLESEGLGESAQPSQEVTVCNLPSQLAAESKLFLEPSANELNTTAFHNQITVVSVIQVTSGHLPSVQQQSPQDTQPESPNMDNDKTNELDTQQEKVQAEAVPSQSAGIATYKSLSDNFLPSGTSIMNRYKSPIGGYQAGSDITPSQYTLDVGTPVGQQGRRWSDDDSGKALEALYGYCVGSDWHSPSEDRVYMSSSKSGSQAEHSSMGTEQHREQIMPSNGEEVQKQSKNDTYSEEQHLQEPENRNQAGYTSPSGQMHQAACGKSESLPERQEVKSSECGAAVKVDGNIPKDESVRYDSQPQRDYQLNEHTTPAVEYPTNTIESSSEVEHSPPIQNSINQSHSLESRCEVKEAGTVKQDPESEKCGCSVQQTFQQERPMEEHEAEPVYRKNQQLSKPQVNSQQVGGGMPGNEEIKSQTHCQCEYEGEKEETKQTKPYLSEKNTPLSECTKEPEDGYEPAGILMVQGAKDDQQDEESSQKQASVSAMEPAAATKLPSQSPQDQEQKVNQEYRQPTEKSIVEPVNSPVPLCEALQNTAQFEQAGKMDSEGNGINESCAAESNQYETFGLPQQHPVKFAPQQTQQSVRETEQPNDADRQNDKQQQVAKVNTTGGVSEVDVAKIVEEPITLNTEKVDDLDPKILERPMGSGSIPKVAEPIQPNVLEASKQSEECRKTESLTAGQNAAPAEHVTSASEDRVQPPQEVYTPSEVSAPQEVAQPTDNKSTQKSIVSSKDELREHQPPVSIPSGESPLIHQADGQREDTEVIQQPSVKDTSSPNDPPKARSNQDAKETFAKQAQIHESPPSPESNQESCYERQAQSTIGAVETPYIKSEHQVMGGSSNQRELLTGQEQVVVQNASEQPTNEKEQPISHQPSQNQIGRSGTSIPPPKVQEDDPQQCKPQLGCQNSQPTATCPQVSETGAKQPDDQPEEAIAERVLPKQAPEIASDGVQPDEQPPGQSSEQQHEQHEIAGQAPQSGQVIDSPAHSIGSLKSGNQIRCNEENATLPKHEAEDKQVLSPSQSAQQQSASQAQQNSIQQLSQPPVEKTVEQIGLAPPEVAGNVQSLRQLAEEHKSISKSQDGPRLMEYKCQGKADAADIAESEQSGPRTQDHEPITAEVQQVVGDDGQSGIQMQLTQQPQPTTTGKFQEGTNEMTVEGANQQTVSEHNCESTDKLVGCVGVQESDNPISPQTTPLTTDKESVANLHQQLAFDGSNTPQESPIGNTAGFAEESTPEQPIQHTSGSDNRVTSIDREVDEAKEGQKNIDIKEVEQTPKSEKLSEAQQQNQCPLEQVNISDQLKQDIDIDRGQLCDEEVRAPQQQVQQFQAADPQQEDVSAVCRLVEEPSISKQDQDQKGVVKPSAVKSQTDLAGQQPMLASQDINTATLEAASVVQEHQQPSQRLHQVQQEDKCSDEQNPIPKSEGVSRSISTPVAAAPASSAIDSVPEDGCMNQSPQSTRYEPKSSSNPLVQDHLEVDNSPGSESSLPASSKLLPENPSQSRKSIGSKQVVLVVQDCPEQATLFSSSHQPSQQKSSAVISPRAAQPVDLDDLGNTTQPNTLQRNADDQQLKQPQPELQPVCERTSRNEIVHQESSIMSHPSLIQQNQAKPINDNSAVAVQKTNPSLKHKSQKKLAKTSGADPEAKKPSRTRIKAATNHIACAPKQFTPRMLVQSACSLPGDHPIPTYTQVPSANKKLRLKRSTECIDNLPRTSCKDIPAIPIQQERLYTAGNNNVATRYVGCSTANFQLEQPRLSNRELQQNGPEPRRQHHQRASTDESFAPEHKVAQHESTRLSDNTIPLSNKNFTKSGANNQSQRHSSQRQSQPRQRIIQEESEEASSEPQQHSQQASQPKSNEPVIIIINSGSACQPPPSMLDHQAMRNYAATMAQQQFVVNHHGPSAQDASRRVSIKEASSQQNRERYSGSQVRADHRRACPDTSRKVLLENLDISQILNNTNEPVPFLPSNINSKGHDSIEEEPSRFENKLNQQAGSVQEQAYPPEQVRKPQPPKRPSLGRDVQPKQLPEGESCGQGRPAVRTKAIAQKRTSDVASQPPETSSKPPNIFDRQVQKQHKQPPPQQPKEAEIYSRILSRNTIQRFEDTSNLPVREPFTLVDAKHRSFPKEFHCSVKDDNVADFEPNPSFSYTVNLIQGLSETFLPSLFRNYPKIGTTSTNYLWSGTWKAVTSPSVTLVAAKDNSQQGACLLACFLEKSIYLYQKKQQISITFADDYFQTLTGCPVLRFPLSQLTPAKTWAMLTQLTNNRKGTYGTRQLLMAVPNSSSDLPFTVLKVEQYQGNKLVQLKGCNSVEPVLMQFDRFCNAFRRVSVGYFNPQFYYSTMPVAIASKVISLGIVAHDTAAIYFWLHEDKELLPYKLCLYLEFEPKKFRFVGQKSFKKTGRLFNATIRGRYLLLLEHKQTTKSEHILCCCSTSPIEMKVQSNEFQRTRGGGYENQGVVLLPVQLEH